MHTNLSIYCKKDVRRFQKPPCTSVEAVNPAMCTKKFTGSMSKIYINSPEVLLGTHTNTVFDPLSP